MISDETIRKTARGYAECCGKCGMGQCYVDQMTGEADEGYGWQR